MGLEAIGASPELYPLDRDAAGKTRLLRLSEADYAAASFLDERLPGAAAEVARVPWAELADAAARLPVGADFIFHIGHVGSTLLARLLGRRQETFALREPALLRTIDRPADDVAGADLLTLLRLYARVWRPGQRSLVKATSFASDLAPAILKADASARAILMTVKPQVYIAGILGGEATRAELPHATPARLRRLAVRQGTEPDAPRGAGEMAAAGWLTETSALDACGRLFPQRSLWLDFDEFLLDPRGSLIRVISHLAGSAHPAELAAMLASPDMTRYSKAPEHAFSAGLRGRILREAAEVHAQEIARGMAWLERAASGLKRPGDS